MHWRRRQACRAHKHIDTMCVCVGVCLCVCFYFRPNGVVQIPSVCRARGLPFTLTDVEPGCASLSSPLSIHKTGPLEN